MCLLGIIITLTNKQTEETDALPETFSLKIKMSDEVFPNILTCMAGCCKITIFYHHGNRTQINLGFLVHAEQAFYIFKPPYFFFKRTSQSYTTRTHKVTCPGCIIVKEQCGIRILQHTLLKGEWFALSLSIAFVDGRTTKHLDFGMHFTKAMERCKRSRQQLIISVEENNPLSPCMLHARISGLTRSTVLLTEQSNARITYRLHNGHGTIRRAVIDNHHLEVIIRLGQHTPQ